MRITPSRFRRAATALAATALAAASLAACGDSEEDQALTFELGKNGAITGPSSAETGLAEITFDNKSQSEGDMQLIRTEGEHSADEVIEAFKVAGSGKPFPDWFFGGGGVGTIGAGKSTTVTQVLQPGTYFAVNTETRPSADAVAELEVTGDASDETVEGDATVSAFEYGFETDGLVAGENEVVFENKGAQPHHVIALKMLGDSTIEDVETFFKTEDGKPPVEEEPSVGTAVIEGGESQVASMDFDPGRYAFVCFITDRQGGPPHVVKGMIDEVEVG